MPQVERFPHPIPYGWYFVGYCDELAPGDVQPLHYFGRDLVLFRDADGKAGLLDAHCPHLGAHLGYGGHVEGNMMRCPFHGWGYDVNGWCRNVPYARVQPPICKREPLIHAYPLTEANGIIWAWYHPQNAAPLFDVEVYPEFTEPGWAKQLRYTWRVPINPQEVAENGVDVAHFQFVHGLPAVPEGESRYHAQVRYTRADGVREEQQPDGSIKRIPSSIETIMNGAGQKVTRFTSETQTSLMVLVTPIEADDAWIRYAFTHTEVPAGSPEEKALQEACWRIGPGPTGITPDLPIWRHKVHVSRPILCDGDGHILRFRQYFAQFYAGEGEPQKVAAE